MLRKLSHIVFSLFLLSSTAGMSISLHYCGDNLVSAAINQEAKSCCEKRASCHNETIQIQIVDDFVDPFIIEQVNIAGTDILFPVAFILPCLQVFELAYTPLNLAESTPTLEESTKLALLQSYRC